MKVYHLGRKVRIGIVATTAAVVPVLGVTSASAATYYSINVAQACVYTYNNPAMQADVASFSNPYSWYCEQPSHTVGVPLGFSNTYTAVGGVNLQLYCTKTYPGSKAVLVKTFPAAFGWRCVK